MKALFTPLLRAIVVALLVVGVFWVLKKTIDIPGWLNIAFGIISLILTGVIGIQREMGLKTYYRAIFAYLTNAQYLYELDIRIIANPHVTIGSLSKLVEERYKTRASLGVRGANYLQVRFIEPPRTVEIRIQPDASQIAFELDDDLENVSADIPQVISIDLVDPVELRYRDSDGKVVRDTFNVLQDLANDIARAVGGQPPYFTVTVNRVAKGLRPKHPKGPGPSGLIQDNLNVRIRRDSTALQLQSNSSSSIVKYLTQNLADLEPVV